jgi:hypothetical protein
LNAVAVLSLVAILAGLWPMAAAALSPEEETTIRAHPGDRLPLTVVNADGRREVTLVVPVMHH